MNMSQIKLRLSNVVIVSAVVGYGYLDLDYICEGIEYHLVYDGYTHNAIDHFKQSETNYYVSFSSQLDLNPEEKSRHIDIFIPVLPTIYLNPAAFNRAKS